MNGYSLFLFVTAKIDQDMRQPIKLIIKKGKVRKDGTSLIFLQYCYSQAKRMLISTDVYIPEVIGIRKPLQY